MHVNKKQPKRKANSKEIAFLGLLLAVAMILTLLGGYLEVSTLFFMAAAAFCTGIAIVECGVSLGGGFTIAGVLLAFILAPNKLYVLTYACMSVYIFLREWVFERIALSDSLRILQKRFRLFKAIIFNIMYVPVLLFFPQLIYQGVMSSKVLILLFIVGQIIFFVYDRAYDYFQASIWWRIKKVLKL